MSSGTSAPASIVQPGGAGNCGLSVDLSRCAALGFMVSSPSNQPTAAPAIGPFHGTSEMAVAAEAPISARISGCMSGSDDVTVQAIATSFRISSGNRAHRPVNHTCVQCNSLRTSFAAGKRTWNFSYRIKFLLKID